MRRLSKVGCAGKVNLAESLRSKDGFDASFSERAGWRQRFALARSKTVILISHRIADVICADKRWYDRKGESCGINR